MGQGGWENNHLPIVSCLSITKSFRLFAAPCTVPMLLWFDLGEMNMGKVSYILVNFTPALPWWPCNKDSSCHAGDVGSIHGSGRSPGERNSNQNLSILAWRILWTEEPGRLLPRELDMTEQLKQQEYILALVCWSCSLSVCIIHSVMLDSLLPPWTVVYQALWSMEVSRQEYWSGLLFPSPRDLPDPGVEPWSPALQADSLPSDPPGEPSCILNYKAKSSITSSEIMELHAYGIYSIKQKWVKGNWIKYGILNWYNDHTETLPGSQVLSSLFSCAL